MRGFLALIGLIAGVVLLAWLALERRLPEPIQAPIDDAARRVLQGPQPGEREASPAPTPAPLDEPEPPPAPLADLPGGDFVPLALLRDVTTTHLVWLAKGAPKHASVKGHVTVVGGRVVRLLLTEADVAVVGPDGKARRQRTPSQVAQIARFDYASAQQAILHPRRPEPLRLDAEDLALGDEVSRFFLREERELLGVHAGHALAIARRALYLGGAHPAETVQIERLRLATGAVVPPGQPRGATAAAAAAWRRAGGADLCIAEHLESAALRGPAGAPLPAAVMGAAYEVCRGEVAFATDKVMLDDLNRRGVALGRGAAWRRGAIVLDGVPLLSEVADAVGLPRNGAAIAVRGPRFLPPVPRHAKAPPRRYGLLRLSRGHKPTKLGRVGTLTGVDVLDDLPDAAIRQLRSVFARR